MYFELLSLKYFPVRLGEKERRNRRSPPSARNAQWRAETARSGERAAAGPALPDYAFSPCGSDLPPTATCLTPLLVILRIWSSPEPLNLLLPNLFHQESPPTLVHQPHPTGKDQLKGLLFLEAQGLGSSSGLHRTEEPPASLHQQVREIPGSCIPGRGQPDAGTECLRAL